MPRRWWTTRWSWYCRLRSDDRRGNFITTFALWIRALLYTALIGLGTLAVLLPILWRRKHSWAYLVFFSIFWVYLLIAVSLTLLPQPFYVWGITREPIGDIFSRIRWMPYFPRPSYHYRYFVSGDMLGNLLLTAPLGFLIPLLFKGKRQGFPWFVLITGIGFEAAQLVVSLIIGRAYRVVEINDVILNTTGAFAGYILFQMAYWFYKKVFERAKIHQHGLE